MAELKLYVWDDCLQDYGTGLMVALASSVDEARELLRERIGYTPGDGSLETEPTVYDQPHAEYRPGSA